MSARNALPPAVYRGSCHTPEGESAPVTNTAATVDILAWLTQGRQG